MADGNEPGGMAEEIERFRNEVQRKANIEGIVFGTIYFIWHLPNWGVDNQQFQVHSCQNKPSVRLLIYQYQKQHRGHFYYSTNQNDLQIDYTLNPRGRPTLGPYVDPPSTIQQQIISRQTQTKE